MREMRDPLRYPIGRFHTDREVTGEKRRAWIEEMAEFPEKARAAVAGLTDAQLDTTYRPEGWTIRQVVHHLPDSHLNGYVRFKLALTEDDPLVKTFDQDRWALLTDGRGAPLELSLALLDAIHRRWTYLLRSLEPADFARTLRHPEWRTVTLDTVLQMYAWHGRHHLAHITSLRERMGWV